MKHLGREQLKKYGERRLNAEETSPIILHLDECGACFDSFREMFPALSDAARKVSFDALTADDADIFHLDYEEHLRPFVDGEADAVTREVVASHSANCSFCARAVRDLQEFSDSAALREIKKNNSVKAVSSGAFVHHSRRFSTANFWRLSLPAAAILIFGIGGWLFWRHTEPQNFIAENQTPKNAPPVSANRSSSEQPEENLALNRANNQTESLIAPRENHPANVKSNTVEAKHREANQIEDELLLAALPPDFRAKFQNAVRTKKVDLPKFIADLREKSNLRGASNGEKNVILSPNAQAERSTRPVFRWRKFAVDGEGYVVTVYDENFSQVAVSPNLPETKWQPDISLKRGKIYRWQVKSEKIDESYMGSFKVLDETAFSRIKKIEAAAPNSPLIRGIGYASEGLLAEAANEFEKEIKRNPRGKPARNLKKSLVEKLIRR